MAMKRRMKGGPRFVPTSLTVVVKTWPTPRTLTGGAESAARKQELGRTESGGGDLQAVAQTWATPTPMPEPDMSPTGMMPDGSKRQVDLSHQARAHSSSGARSSIETRRLNPRFVEWLMGWPAGWTDCGSPVTESFPSWLALHSSLLHEGLV